MHTIDTYDFSGKTALIRVDFNVPLNTNFEITDDTRIKSALPTLQKVLENGGAVVIMSHLGRPKGGAEDRFSLRHLVQPLRLLLKKDVQFAKDCIGAEAVNKARALQAGEVLLLENLRFYQHETTGSVSFAESLSKLGDVYINDAFGTAHRAHASTTIIAQFFPKAKMFGCLMEKEIENVDKILHQSEKPLTAIMGGAKVSSKIGIIQRLLEKTDHLIIGGGMTYTFIKAQGGEVGASLVEDDKLDLAMEILQMAKQKNVHIHLPVDTVVADAFDNNANKQTCKIDQIPAGWMGLDIGPETEKTYHDVIAQSKTLLWNGPMGVFEMSNFEHGTKHVAESIVAATANGAFSLIGGGDSVAAINTFGMEKQVSYISTGGGALLEYLEGIELPGIKAIRSALK
jgi:phosphoglycerate kinase